MQITSYEILEFMSANELEKEVMLYISEGWEPLGGIAMVYGKFAEDESPNENGKNRMSYAQAMIMR